MKKHSAHIALPIIALAATTATHAATNDRPNVIVILVDDMGYSDIGCYGGEIPTPNIDKLAKGGTRFTQFYTASRSCPTRASLMTGLYPHQTGIGYMTEEPTAAGAAGASDWGTYGYKGYLNRDCVTLGEVFRESNYHTYMVGKWHLGIHGEEKYPLQRGFDRFYGILAGACSYFAPTGAKGLSLDNEKLPTPEAPYYTTDAFTDYALEFIESESREDPFFLYLSYNAPHWPLQAKDEDIEKFIDLYRQSGWNEIRAARLERMAKMGIVDGEDGFAEWENRNWDELTEQEKDESAYRMATYAAQVHSVDYNIGRLITHLKKSKQLDNTLILFLSDNGACAEPYKELGGGAFDDINNPETGGMISYGRAWAQVANTPFRKYKRRAYEGGLSTSFIVSWRDGFGNGKGRLCDTPAFLPDIMATMVDLCDLNYPEQYHGGREIHPMVGTSLRPAIEDGAKSLHEYMFWEHTKNQAVRYGDWKAIKDEGKDEWELYNIKEDRVERNNLASQQTELLEKLKTKWSEWATQNYVLPKRAN